MLPDIEELDRLVRNIGRDELLPRFAHNDKLFADWRDWLAGE